MERQCVKRRCVERSVIRKKTQFTYKDILQYTKELLKYAIIYKTSNYIEDLGVLGAFKHIFNKFKFIADAEVVIDPYNIEKVVLQNLSLSDSLGLTSKIMLSGAVLPVMNEGESIISLIVNNPKDIFELVYYYLGN